MQTKLSREFATAVAAFQKVSRLSAEKQRSFVENQKRRVEELVDDDRCVALCDEVVMTDFRIDEPRGSVELEQVQTQQQAQQWVRSANRHVQGLHSESRRKSSSSRKH